MGKLNLTREELYYRNGVLDKIMDTVFDVSILVDEKCSIIFISESSYHDLDIRKKLIGKHISVIDNISPFEEVISTGKAATGLLLEIAGRKCVSSIFPVFQDNKVIGAMGTIVFRNLRRVKRMFNDTNGTDISSEVGQLYSNISRMEGGYSFDDFLGESDEVKILKEKAEKAALHNLPILIMGETGTGKEILSGAIHGKRHHDHYSPYVTINCTAIPENLLESELFGHEKGAFTGADSIKIGKFELASGGDILLDEIGDMNMLMQSKLLRVLESKEFERVGGHEIIPLRAGIIASTNKNLFLLSKERSFRSDLYYRLNTIELFVPPLRSRKDDIPILINSFLDELEYDISFDSASMNMLKEYPWPGNVRQLKNLVNRLIIFYENSIITEDDIYKELIIGQQTYNSAFDSTFDPFTATKKSTSYSSLEQEMVRDALNKSKNNISRAAKLLGISRGTLYKRIEQFHIEI